MGKQTKKTGRTVTTKRLRELKGKMSLHEFAKRCSVGISTMFNYLHGRDIPSRMMTKICINCGCSADYLLGVKDGGAAGNAEIKVNMLIMQIESDIKAKQRLLASLEVDNG